MEVDKSKPEEEACILRFYKIVLSWDSLRILEESERNHDKKIGEGGVMGLKKVKDAFNTFVPLIFEEVKALISRGEDEEEVFICSEDLQLIDRLYSVNMLP